MQKCFCEGFGIENTNGIKSIKTIEVYGPNTKTSYSMPLRPWVSKTANEKEKIYEEFGSKEQ